MKHKTLKVAVVGLGEQSCDNLIPAILSSEYAEIYALCDINEDILKKVSNRFGIKNIFLNKFKI